MQKRKQIFEVKNEKEINTKNKTKKTKQSYLVK